MKKYIAMAAFALSAALIGCAARNTTLYTQRGTYEPATGTVYTVDGNAWEFSKDNYRRACPVVVVFDNNNTPEYIYDDIIVNIIRDR